MAFLYILALRRHVCALTKRRFFFSPAYLERAKLKRLPLLSRCLFTSFFPASHLDAPRAFIKHQPSHMWLCSHVFASHAIRAHRGSKCDSKNMGPFPFQPCLFAPPTCVTQGYDYNTQLSTSLNCLIKILAHYI